MVIKNRATLISHGNVQGRKVALDILEAGLKAPDPYDNTVKMVRIKGDRLIVGLPELSKPEGLAPLEFNLSEIKNIYIDDMDKFRGDHLIFSVPTVLIFSEGKELLRESRYINYDKITRLIDMFTN